MAGNGGGEHDLSHGSADAVLAEVSLKTSASVR